tara:strand:- start:602 stop:1273 length:672 start_codon:yes stop_codon:yes gene_type:complete
MSSIQGLHVLGEANFSDHGANRLGASALMQGLADGYFIIPYTIGDYLANTDLRKVDINDTEFKNAINDTELKLNKMLDIQGNKTVDDIHKELGKIMWEYVGMARNKDGLNKAMELISSLKSEFWENVKIPGSISEYNPELEKASRLADFLELGELMARDALTREESCGGHFREEYQTEENEAKRNDDSFAFVSTWNYKEGEKENLVKENLNFEEVTPTTRSYK